MRANMVNTSIAIKTTKFILNGFFVLLFLGLPSCQSSLNSKSSLSKEEHQALESLFSHFFLYQGGAYTLFGSKPLSFEVFSRIPDEEKQEFFSFSTHPIIVNELNFFENWDVWKRLENRFTTPRFLFFERNPPSFSRGDVAVFLVNISNTIATLQKHYAKFRSALGVDFDPLDIVFEIQNEGSKFWNVIFEREDLLGILLGYGEENPYLFIRVKEWEMQRQFEGPKNRFLASLSTQTFGSNSFAPFDASFPLPSFGCYSEEESALLIKMYENEREKIKANFRGKDFVQVILDRLMSKDLATNLDDQYKEQLTRELKIKDQPLN